MGKGSSKLDLTPPNFSIELKEKIYSIGQIPNPNPDIKQYTSSIVALGVGSDLIQIYDVQKQTLIKEFEGCGYSKADQVQIIPAFSPDEKMIAYRWHNKVKLRNMDNIDFIKEIQTECGGDVVNITWSLDSQFLCIGSCKDMVTIYNMKTDKMIGHFKAKVHVHQQVNQYSCIHFNIFPKFSNCGKFLVVRWDNFAQVYKVESTECKLDIELKHKKDVQSINFSNDGKLLAIGNGSESFQIWDFYNKSMVADIKGSPKSLTSYLIVNPSWSSDGKYFVCRWYKEAYIYDTSSWNLVEKFNIGDNVAFLKFSPDSQLLAVGGKNHLTIWDVNSKQIIKAMQCCTYDLLGAIEIDAVWTSNSQIAGRWEKSLRVWNL